MAETLSMISMIAFVAAGVFFVVSIIFWGIFKIPFVIGDLSGRNARKSIEQMRKNNEKAGKANQTRRKKEKKTVKKQKRRSVGKMPETGLLEESKAKDLEENETELLLNGATTELLRDKNETVLLKEKRKKKNLILLEEVIFIHTDERLE